MEILTRRFLLRDFREEDAAAFQEYHADPRCSEFYGVEEIKPGHAQQLLETFNKWPTEKPRHKYQFAIIQRQGSQLLVGCCGLRTADSEASKGEFGIELAPKFWGRYGYAIEIMHALGDLGFGTLKLRDIYGGTVSANARIARLANSFGAVATTRPTPWMAARGWSQVEWHVTREQWETGRLAMFSTATRQKRRTR
jgi:ribosomal-protein-alanine N-acetyltransferase